MKYQAYPEYKDSGVEWLDSVPIHWTSVPIKYMALENGSLFLDGDWIESKDLSDDGIRYITTGNVGEGIYKEQGGGYITENKFIEIACTEVFEGDVLISRLNAPIGRACVVPNLESKIVTSVDNVIFRPDHHYCKNYIVHLFSSEAYFKHTGNLARGATMQRISRGILGNIRVVVPSAEEQTKIANFLDHETAKIDTLIEKQQLLIKLLKEKRQAVISHAVTKGLNSNVPMRDSGVEWLGEVPGHWIITRAKFLFDFVTSGSRGWAEYYSDEGSLFFRITNLTRDTIEPKLESIQNVSPPSGSEGERSKIKENDLLISITADLGSVCVANNEIVGGYVSQHVSLCRPNRNVASSRWLGFYILSDVAKEQFIGSGYGGTKIQLSLEDIRELWVVQPSSQDQIEIAKYIESQLEIFEKLIMCAEEQIKLLQERRSALISAAITGKIDVRYFKTTGV
jgi:type I restriction enzyme S subunit